MGRIETGREPVCALRGAAARLSIRLMAFLPVLSLTERLDSHHHDQSACAYSVPYREMFVSGGLWRRLWRVGVSSGGFFRSGWGDCGCGSTGDGSAAEMGTIR